MASILCIDDAPDALDLLVEHIVALGHEPVRATTPASALAALATRPIDIIVSDFQLPGLNGSELLGIVRDQGYQCPFIIVTAFASIEQSVAAIRGGAVNYLAKPVSRTQLEASLQQALELLALREEVAALRAEASSAKVARRIVGDSAVIRDVMNTVASVAATRATVLIEGESGTGKELFARALHDLSDRARRPFIRLNCAALPEGLIESSLFGHERGAFTGAMKRSEGAFERADGGTLLLDEISEMRLDLQAKLLRVLQEQEFERVGGNTMLKVDVRVVATTNRDLAAEARAGSFRSDLYYRLKVVHLRIPPLRERPDDIAALANTFVRRFADETGRQIDHIDRRCLEMLCTLPWPGNVRELEHAVYRAVLLADSPVLTASAFVGVGEGLPIDRRGDDAPVRPLHAGYPDLATGSPAGSPAVQPVVLPASSGHAQAEPVEVLHSYDLETAERVLIEGALRRCNGNRTRAASLLGINVRTLRRKLAEDRAEDAGDDADPTPTATSVPDDLAAPTATVSVGRLAYGQDAGDR